MSPAVRVVLVLTAVQALAELSASTFASLLPGFLGAAGVSPVWSPWVLVVVYGLRATGDLLAGACFDRPKTALRPIGAPVWAVSSMAVAAFVALPWLEGRPLGTLGCAALWTFTSSVFGVPLTVLLLRHAALRARPELALFVALGTGLAGWLSVTVTEALPREGIHRTFGALALMLWLLAAMSFVTERSLTPTVEPVPSLPPSGTSRRVLLRMLVATLLSLLSAQWFERVVAPSLRRARELVGAEGTFLDFPFGVALASLVTPSIRWFGLIPMATLGATMAALGAATTAVSHGALTTAALVWTGVGWGTVRIATWVAVVAQAPEGQRARWTGAWFAVQALATSLRTGIEATLPACDEAWARTVTVVTWMVAAGLLLCGGRDARRVRTWD